MIVSIMQPAYLPWPGYFHRIMASDMHIIFDNVDIDWKTKTQFANRNRIRTPQGPVWLTVPLSKGGGKRLDHLRIAEEIPWRKKHCRTLDQNYAKAPFYREHAAAIQDIITTPVRRFLDLVTPLTDYLLGALDITTPCLRSSGMIASSKKSRLVLDLCLEAGATVYLSGPFGRTYLDADAFAAAGVELLFHDYAPTPYPQCFPGFVPALSAVDMLFNLGPDAAAHIRAGQEASISKE
jgi:hypothetical protein